MTPLKEIAPDTHIRCRSIFLSDWHLGARAANPSAILAVLRNLTADRIYLVGDILDIWHGGRVHWSAEVDQIIAELRRMALSGVQITYLPGNHDHPMRKGANAPNGGWEILDEVVHETADGNRYLVIHGDQCDGRLFRNHFMTRLGSRMDCLLRWLDGVHRARFDLAETRRTPAECVINWFNHFLSMGTTYERRAVALAAAKNADGVICGHSHKPALRVWDDLIFANCGDWVDGMTGLIEGFDGQIELLDFFPLVQAAQTPAVLPAEESPLPGATA